MRWLPVSLRGRLLLGLLSTFLAVSLFLVVSGYRAARHEVDELFDAELAHYARVIDGLLAPALERGLDDLNRALIDGGWNAEAHPDAHAATPEGHAYETKIAFQVWSDDGRLKSRSRGAPEGPFGPPAPGYATRNVDGELWRVFTLAASVGGGYLQAAQRMEIREELERRIAWRSVEDIALALPLMAGLVWLTVGIGLRPLRRLSDLITRRDYNSLRPIGEPRHQPLELRPISAALNALFERVNSARMREKRFLDEAAHELRTPLAALQIHAENALAARDEDERRRCLGELLQSSERAGHFAAQLLTLARLESDTANGTDGSADLSTVAEEAVELVAPQARRRQQHLSVHMPEDLPAVAADADVLTIALRNLLDNATRYSPEASTISVGARCQGDDVVLEVCDQGPGIPLEARERVWERFTRLDRGEVAGTGLGLAIVARICEQLGARVELGEASGGRGLRVSLKLRRAA